MSIIYHGVCMLYYFHYKHDLSYSVSRKFTENHVIFATKINANCCI